MSRLIRRRPVGKTGRFSGPERRLSLPEAGASPSWLLLRKNRDRPMEEYGFKHEQIGRSPKAKTVVRKNRDLGRRLPLFVLRSGARGTTESG